MSKELLNVYNAVFGINKEFINEFKNIAPINTINLAISLDIELKQRVINPLSKNTEIDFDDKNLGFINVKINKLLDTLNIYKSGYKENKINKETMSDYLVGNKALDEIKKEMSTQNKDTKKDEQENKNTQANVRRNK